MRIVHGFRTDKNFEGSRANKRLRKRLVLAINFTSFTVRALACHTFYCSTYWSSICLYLCQFQIVLQLNYTRFHILRRKTSVPCILSPSVLAISFSKFMVRNRILFNFNFFLLGQTLIDFPLTLRICATHLMFTSSLFCAFILVRRSISVLNNSLKI